MFEGNLAADVIVRDLARGIAADGRASEINLEQAEQELLRLIQEEIRPVMGI